MMIANLVAIRPIKYSMIPRLILEMELYNDSSDHHVWIYGWTGQLYMQHPKHLLIGNLSTEFNVSHMPPLAKTKIRSECDITHEKLEIIEDVRQGLNWQIGINLKLLHAFLPTIAQPPHDISEIRSEDIGVQSSTGGMPIEIARSIWDDTLADLNYGSIFTLRFTFPPPPLVAQLDKSIGYIKDAQKKINDGEWPDALVSCRKAIEELEKLISKNDEKRKAFFQSILKDEEKAKDCEDLWETIKKAKNFASGGPHTYWVRTADRRDAELAIRVVSAFVGYFANNLARASAS